MKIKQKGTDYFPMGYFLIPIFIASVCNLGIIFSIPNFFREASFFGGVLNALSSNTNTRSSVVELAIGIVSGTLIFFAFIQIAYSFKQFPLAIVTKYITYSRKTKEYILYQIGTIVMLVVFALCENVFYIDWLLSLCFFIASVIFSFKYFFWLVDQFKDFGILDLMIEKIDLEAVNNYYNPLDDKAKAVISEYGSKAQNKDIRYISDIEPNYFPIYEVRTRLRGIVQKIDFLGLQNQIRELKKIEPNFFFRLNKNYGAQVPNIFEPNAEDKTSLLITVYLDKRTVESAKESTEIPDPKLENERLKKIENNLKMTVAKSKDKITKCFTIDERDLRQEVETILNDVLTLHATIATAGDNSMILLLKKIKLFVAHFSPHLIGEKSGKNRTVSNILINLVFELGAKVWDEEIDDSVLRSYLDILADIVEVALKSGNDQLSNSSLNLSFGIHSRLAIASDKYAPAIRNVIQKLIMLGIIKPLRYAEKEINSGQNISDKRDQILSAIDHSLTNGVRFIYYLCKHSYNRTDEETFIYLEDNLNAFIDPIERFTNIGETESIAKEMLSKHGKYILQLAVYLFMQIENRVFPRKWLTTIVYPLAENCASYWHKEGWDGIDQVINTTIHLRDFPSEEFDTREMFSVAPIPIPDAGINDSYSPDKFWICFAIYRKKFYENRKYIPAGLMENPLAIIIAGETVAERYLEILGKIEIEELGFLCNLSSEEAEKEGKLYVDYLLGLLKKNDERIEQLKAGTFDPDNEDSDGEDEEGSDGETSDADVNLDPVLGNSNDI